MKTRLVKLLRGRPAGDRLTPEVTREVWRTGSKAMLTDVNGGAAVTLRSAEKR